MDIDTATLWTTLGLAFATVILAIATLRVAQKTGKVASSTDKVANATKDLVRVEAIEKRLAAHAAVWGIVYFKIIDVAGQEQKLSTIFGMISKDLTRVTFTEAELKEITKVMIDKPHAFDAWLWNEYMEKVAVGRNASLGKEWAKWFEKLHSDYMDCKRTYEMATKGTT